MGQPWLTVKMVGELQECTEDGRDIGPLVSSLRGATLPGFVEYRCLRRAKKDVLPPLPKAISSSTIGKAFAALRPAPSSRTGTSSFRRIDTKPAEFHVLHTDSAPEDENWKAFTIRFNRSAQATSVRRSRAAR